MAQAKAKLKPAETPERRPWDATDVLRGNRDPSAIARVSRGDAL